MRKASRPWIALGFGVALGASAFAQAAPADLAQRVRQEAADPAAAARAAAHTVERSPEEARVAETARFFDSSEVSIVPSAAFTADGFLPTSTHFSFSTALLFGNSEGYGCVVARLHPRNNIAIREIAATVEDNSTASIVLRLYRIDTFAGGATIIGELASSGAVPGLRVLSSTAIVDGVIDVPNYSYYWTTCLNNVDTKVLSVRVYYDVALFSDGFESGNTSAWSTTVP